MHKNVLTNYMKATSNIAKPYMNVGELANAVCTNAKVKKQMLEVIYEMTGIPKSLIEVSSIRKLCVSYRLSSDDSVCIMFIADGSVDTNTIHIKSGDRSVQMSLIKVIDDFKTGVTAKLRVRAKEAITVLEALDSIDQRYIDSTII